MTSEEFRSNLPGLLGNVDAHMVSVNDALNESDDDLEDSLDSLFGAVESLGEAFQGWRLAKLEDDGPTPQ